MFNFLSHVGLFWVGCLAGCVISIITLYIAKKLSGSWDRDTMAYIQFLEREVEKTTLCGFVVKQGKRMKPGENVFTQDLYNMGRQIGLMNSCRVMLMSGHNDEEEGHYFHIVREDTGEKITIIFEEDAKGDDADRNVIFRRETKLKDTRDDVTGFSEEG